MTQKFVIHVFGLSFPFNKYPKNNRKLLKDFKQDEMIKNVCKGLLKAVSRMDGGNQWMQADPMVAQVKRSGLSRLDDGTDTLETLEKYLVTRIY